MMWISQLQDRLFETVVQPVLYYFGLIYLDEQAFAAIEIFIYGVIEIAAIYVLLRPLEAWRPIEAWQDRRAVRVDVLYTFLHRLGLLPLLFYALLTPVLTPLETALRLKGLMPGNLEQWLGVGMMSFLGFLIYILVLDLAEYVRHRLQHRLNWWWALHALHHSQRQLSFWADDRNHIVDDVLANVWFAAVALIIGVPPGQFVLIAIAMRGLESLSHANVRLDFGPILGRVLVGPRYHRTHHAIGLGHEGQAQGCNFATIFPIWDIVFGTADYRAPYGATGIRDQLSGVDYGEGFWRQQWLGLKRLAHSLAPRAHTIVPTDDKPAPKTST